MTLLKVRWYGITDYNRARDIFDKCEPKDVEIYAEMMSIYVNKAMYSEAFELHKSMIASGLKDNDDTTILFALSVPENKNVDKMSLNSLIYKREFKKVETKDVSKSSRHLMLYYRKMFERLLDEPSIVVQLYEQGKTLKLDEGTLLEYVVLSHVIHGGNSEAMTWVWTFVRKGYEMKPSTYRKVLQRMLQFKNNAEYSLKFIKIQKKFGLKPSTQHIDDFIRSNPNQFEPYLSDLMEYEWKPGTFYRLLQYFKGNTEWFDLIWEKCCRDAKESGIDIQPRIKELVK